MFSAHIFLSFSILISACGYNLTHFLCFTFSIHSYHLLYVSSQARTGLWVWTVLTYVMATTGKKMCQWTFFHMMQELTAGSPSRLPTLRPSHRIKSHRWAAQVHESVVNPRI